MKARFWLVTVIVLILALGAAYMRRDEPLSQTPAKKEEANVARPKVTVEAAPVTTGRVEEALELVGATKSKFEATVRSEYTGKLADVYITEWVTVKKGQPLARLDTSEYESQLKGAEAAVAQTKADLMRTEAAAGKALRDYERTSKLNQEGIVSEQNLDDARQQRDVTAAEEQAARARKAAAEGVLRQVQVKLNGSVLRAPMDGVVANRKANVGQFVDNMGQGDPLFRIVDNTLLDVVLQVPATEISRVRAGQPVDFTTEFLPGKIFTAQVTYINPSVELATRAVNIVAEMRNTTGELRDGLFVKGRIVVGRRNGVLQVPKAALLAGGNGELFVIEDGKACKRAVQTGSELGEMVEVRVGLKKGELVVTRGAFMLQDGDLVRIAPTPVGAKR
jgi:membrane fusion protein, multidrug efflux system